MIIDCHCDALLKMWAHQVDFNNDLVLDVNYQKWLYSPVQIQCFAIYVPEYVPNESKFIVALQMVDLFHEKIIKSYSNIKWIKEKADFDRLQAIEKGAILTLEGLDCIGSDLFKLRLLIQLGVRMIGLSWNYANLAVDGIDETRRAGLTHFGIEVIELANKEQVWVDLAHVSREGFQDALQIANHVIVSHANSRSICHHRRNLDDEQIKQLIKKNGLIGITFVEKFVVNQGKATIEDLLQHIAYIIHLGGGEDHLVFGSDFDGTDRFIEDLVLIADYQNLDVAIHQKFHRKQCEKMEYLNFIRHFPS
ncbi:microsomal dipeptidase [Gracilibacillus boraciitolerans JCM 21714]|uniref:Microsomal dipeptidase n=1 Tax=Gracilibacillus boraciitolerans JCM 21714 TaxID=1298598 RepID=W4VFK3_9BACI|nr:membrane dipeptidase [Gracilibacillus boraciitolerans]GAE91539.1 microsomal dipeptidase [Gracilibacillus boraciitolerans JCM 21714]